MAWAEKLPSGKYRGLYRDSFDRRKSAGTFTHKPKAVRAAAALEEAARKSLLRDADAYRKPWSEWADKWEKARTVEASTARADKMRRKNHLDDRWADVQLGAITRHDVKEWAADLRAKGLGNESVKRAVHLLSASLTAAVDAEILGNNPAARLGLPGGVQADERFLTKKEYALLRANLPTEHDQIIADVLVHTGLRWGELAGLHWSRVDFKRGVLKVVETYDEVDRTMKAYPKGKRTREVPLTPEVIAGLKKLERRGADCGAEHVRGRCPGALVFKSEDGKPLRNSNWSYRVWVKAVEAADLGHVRIHDCRHTYASWLLQGGVSLAEVGKLLGHVSPTTTQRYAHLAETPSAAVLAALAAPRKPHDEADKEQVSA